MFSFGTLAWADSTAIDTGGFFYFWVYLKWVRIVCGCVVKVSFDRWFNAEQLNNNKDKAKQSQTKELKKNIQENELKM